MGLEVYLFFAGGVFVGFCLTCIIQRFKTIFGILKVDRSDPTKDIYTMHIENLDSINGKKRAILKIEDITHK